MKSKTLKTKIDGLREDLRTLRNNALSVENEMNGEYAMEIDALALQEAFGEKSDRSFRYNELYDEYQELNKQILVKEKAIKLLHEQYVNERDKEATKDAEKLIARQIEIVDQFRSFVESGANNQFATLRDEFSAATSELLEKYQLMEYPTNRVWGPGHKVNMERRIFFEACATIEKAFGQAEETLKGLNQINFIERSEVERRPKRV